MKGHWRVHKRPQLVASIKGVLGREGRVSLCTASLTGLGDIGLSLERVHPLLLHHRSRDWSKKYPMMTGLGGTGLTTFSRVATLLLASLCFLSGDPGLPHLAPPPHDPYSWLP